MPEIFAAGRRALHERTAALLDERVHLLVDTIEKRVVLPVLLGVLDQLLYSLGEAHTVDAAFDSEALNDRLLTGKIRRHAFSTPSRMVLTETLEFLLAIGMCWSRMFTLL